MDKARVVKIIFFIALFLITINTVINTVKTINESNITSKQCVESDQRCPKIKKSIKSFNIDGYPVFIYLSNDDQLVLTAINKKNHIFYIAEKNLKNEIVPDCSGCFENENDHGVIYGFCYKDEVKKITVNGKAVQSVELKNIYKDKKEAINFWYTVLNVEAEYKVKIGDKVINMI